MVPVGTLLLGLPSGCGFSVGVERGSIIHLKHCAHDDGATIGWLHDNSKTYEAREAMMISIVVYVLFVGIICYMSG